MSDLSAVKQIQLLNGEDEKILNELKNIKGVCLDIDETLSTHGKLTSEAYEALWYLKENGFFVVPITGRPAGWCDHIVRFWPVDAVIGENGAFTFFMDGKVRSRLETPKNPDVTGSVSVQNSSIQNSEKEKLLDLSQKIKIKFPQAQWASDQAYREYDLAIDFCEDVKPWPMEDVRTLQKFCEDQGAHAKISSIHVNAWFGDYDKCKGFEYWMKNGYPGLRMRSLEDKQNFACGFNSDVETVSASESGTKTSSKVGLKNILSKNEWLFIGDSPNDEPLFRYFNHSVGVANLKNFQSQLKFPPRWITASESGAGFCEMAECLVEASERL